ncbi:MAG: transporter permease subunit [Paenibacillaceae bacterium]|jgi:putative aldouronate transport system permease protein|nr:transporter permease subunit [Paenibacillaceae bacterium]
MRNTNGSTALPQGLLPAWRTGRQKRILWETLEISILALPGVLYFFIFHYLPMFGLTLAFKDYRYDQGILGSKWIGLKNFTFFFQSDQAWRVTRNTVAYSATFTILGIIAALTVALLLFEVVNRSCIKIYQTAMILPSFMSWVMVAFIFYIILNPTSGLIAQIRSFFGWEPINFYNVARYWPPILVSADLWKTVGMSSIIYYAGLMGIDKELYEAAEIDGAGKWRQVRSISIPHLVPLITILAILSIGNFFRGDFGLFYNLPRNIGMLYSTTDVIDTYIYRGLIQIGDIGMTAAIGFFQSVMGLLLVLLSNWIVRRINADNSLF